MLDLARATHPTVTELRQRIAELQDAIRLIETDLAGGLDPRLTALTRVAVGHINTTQEAVNQASLAIDSGNKARCQARLKVARDTLQQAAQTVSKIESGAWAEEEG